MNHNCTDNHNPSHVDNEDNNGRSTDHLQKINKEMKKVKKDMEKKTKEERKRKKEKEREGEKEKMDQERKQKRKRKVLRGYISGENGKDKIMYKDSADDCPQIQVQLGKNENNEVNKRDNKGRRQKKIQKLQRMYIEVDLNKCDIDEVITYTNKLKSEKKNSIWNGNINNKRNEGKRRGEKGKRHNKEKSENKCDGTNDENNKEKTLHWEDYANILKAEMEYIKQFEENKVFFECVKKIHSSHMIRDFSYSLFLFNLFVKGDYLNQDKLQLALLKDAKEDKTCNNKKEQPYYNKEGNVNNNNVNKKTNNNKHDNNKHDNNKFDDNKSDDNESDNNKHDNNKLVNNESNNNCIKFFKGKNTRRLICDFLKILLNNIQNEEFISKHFYITDYVETCGKREKGNSYSVAMSKTYSHGESKTDKEKRAELRHGMKRELHQERWNCTNKNFINKNFTDNNSTNKGNFIKSTNQHQQKVTDNETIPKEKTILPIFNEEECIKMNEEVYNQILNTFVTELKWFFFSLLKRIKSSIIIGKMISIFCEICLILTPYYISITNFFDILSEFANIVPLEGIDYFISFFETYRKKFIEKYKEFQNFIIFNEPAQSQSIGAKLIRFMNILQKKMKSNSKKSSQIFFLNLLLAECLPIKHLGFCNRTFLKNNWNFLFYNSFDDYKHFVNKDVITYGETERNIQRNITNADMIQKFVKDHLTKIQNKNNHTSSSSEKENRDNTFNKNMKNEKKENEKFVTLSESEKEASTNINKIVIEDNIKRNKRNREEQVVTELNEGLSGEGRLLTKTERGIEMDKETKKEAKEKRDNEIVKRRKIDSGNDGTNNENDDDGDDDDNNDLNEVVNNYKAYLSFIYLTVFIKCPERFISSNNTNTSGNSQNSWNKKENGGHNEVASMRDVHKAFTIFYAHVKKNKKREAENKEKTKTKTKTKKKKEKKC